MGKPYAEVIGDPVAHSKSPAIHLFWLKALGLPGDYRIARVPSGRLAAHLESRRGDPWWRGCNLTAPLKREGAELLGGPAGVSSWLGAVNCVFRSPLACLVGANTDLAGIEAALGDLPLEGESVLMLGAGGAARSALCWLVTRKVGQVTILARDPAAAQGLRGLLPTSSGTSIEVEPLDRAESLASGLRLVVNATPMGMAGGPPPSAGLAELIGRLDRQASVFDMVYAPAETALLRAARERGLACVDGLAMLIGQAAPAFELFFGASPPRDRDTELRGHLAS